MWSSVVAVAVAITLCYSTNFDAYVITACALTLYLSLGGSHTLWLVYRTFPRDVRGLYRYLKLLMRIHHAKKNNLSVPKIFQEVVRKNRNKVAFYFEDETWTFQQVDELSNKVGNYFAAKGVKHGEPVALFMENCVEYICIWLGLTKIGAVPALINYNLRLDSLKHCIQVAACKAVICGAEVQAAMADIRDSEDISSLQLYVFGAGEELTLKDAVSLDAGLNAAASTTPTQLHNVNFSDKMVFIYTSGTTGMPKAAVIKHSRTYFAGEGMSTFIGLTSSDILYDPLPLYHTAGGIIGLGHSLFNGGSTVIKRKFSVSHFWSDCVKYKCTVAQYIGEICRYLYNMPEKSEDKGHQIRLMFGNGLRPNLWKDFQTRFNIPRISEFYGSTEGNANIINMDGKIGAVGFVSVLFPSVYPVALIKVDEETKEIVRDANGMCIMCKPGEPGEFIGKIVRDDPVRDFHGYADDSATKKKIVRDVFKKGDYAFLSGDILMMDEEGYLYFKDRTGDTFRWKGENVSTSEVEAVISKTAGHADVVVYGVEVGTVLVNIPMMYNILCWILLIRNLGNQRTLNIRFMCGFLSHSLSFLLHNKYITQENFKPEFCEDFRLLHHCTLQLMKC
ncbi:long-chain fatty acid transport protein 4 isoform X3 [Cherax quadricarinatus]